MKTSLITVSVILVVLLCIRFARGYFASRVERPAYIVVATHGAIQIRQMPTQIYATVTVTGSESQAPRQAFGILAGFIFGGNKSRTSVSMTAPVLTQKQSESIAMTAPVLSQKTNEGSYQVSFVMPKTYTMDTLPVPNDPRILIHTVEGKKIAVITFDAYATQSRIDNYRSKLLDGLTALQIQTTGESFVAQYNDPWTPPMMRTNEIWIEIAQK